MNTNQLSQPNKRKSSLINKKTIKTPGTRRTGLWVAFILFIAALIGAYSLWPCLNNADPQLNYIEVSRDGESLNLLNGETIRFHPRNKLRIMDISTNICFNRGVRLVADGPDINSLLYDDVLLSDLLPDKEIYGVYTFRLWVKRYNQDIGHMDIVIEPLAEDWLDKAEKSTEGDKKIEVLKGALKAFPDERRIKDRLVNEYISVNKWDEAAGILEGMVKEKPDQEILKNLLDVYENMSSTEGIISTLRRLINLRPDEMDLRLKLADALDKAGRATEAISTYEELLSRMKGEDLLPIYNNLGYLYAETGDNAKAISFYLKALELNKDDVNIYHNLSLLYEKTGRKDEANLYLKKAVELNSGDIEANLDLAENLFNNGKVKEAEDYVKAVLKNDPKSLDAWLLMMNIAEKRGDKEALKTAYRNINALQPKNMNVIFNLGVLEYEAGNPDKALPYLERYVESSPGDSDARSILFDIYKGKKKDDLAFKEASAIIGLKPSETDCYQFIFDYLSKKERYGEISGIMGAGVKANPKDVNIKKYLIISYLKTGKENQAITQIKAVLNLTPNDTAMLLQLAKLYEKQDKLDEALAAYKKILDISPDNEEAEEAYLSLRLKTIPK
jgi:tetratricopeptide (TPR) repeat protein